MAIKLEVRGKPPIGSVLSIDEQEYRLVEYRPVMRGDRIGTNLVWRSTCPRCGSEFDSQTIGMSARPTRRCAPCRAEVGMAAVGAPGFAVRIMLHMPEPEQNEKEARLP